MIDLRKVEKSFSHDLAELWTVTYEEAYKEEHTAENIHAYCAENYTVDAAMDALTNPDIVCKVAFDNHAPVGFYLIKHSECPVPLDGGSSELKQIYILADQYGSGVGKLLFDDALCCVQEAGRSWIWLSVSDRNLRAQSFYRKLGFSSLGEGPVFEIGSDRLTSTIMAREI